MSFIQSFVSVWFQDGKFFLKAKIATISLGGVCKNSLNDWPLDGIRSLVFFELPCVFGKFRFCGVSLDVKRFDVICIPFLEGSSYIADVFFRVSANIILDFGFVDNISCQALVIQWTKFFISTITVFIISEDIMVIKHARKSLLLNGDTSWIKRGDQLMFHAAMGSFNGAEGNQPQIKTVIVEIRNQLQIKTVIVEKRNQPQIKTVIVEIKNVVHWITNAWQLMLCTKPKSKIMFAGTRKNTSAIQLEPSRKGMRITSNLLTSNDTPQKRNFPNTHGSSKKTRDLIP